MSSKQEVIDYCFCTPLRCTNGDTAQLCSELHNEPFDQPRRTFENDRDYLYDYPGENSVLIGEGVFTIARGLDVCLGAADCSSASEPNSDGTRTYFCADDRQVRSGVPATRERCVNVVDCTAITNEQSCTRNLRCRYSFSSRSCVPDVDCNVPQSACVIRAGCMWQVTPIEQ